MDASSSAAELPSPAAATDPASDEQRPARRGRASGASRKDRRRMQNRVAQRAYRQRKESAIDLLSDKVSQLEKSREEMSQEFINFTTVILNQEATKNCPEILEYIRQSSSRMLRTAAGITDAVQAQDLDAQPACEVEAEILPTATPAVEQVGQPNLSASTAYAAERGDATRADPGAIPTDFDWDTFPQTPDPYVPMPANQTEEIPFINVQLPGASYASSLPCPRTYAAQEQTFARRLHRACQEGGFLLASMKNPPPLLYQKVFKFCMHFETREEIRLRMLDILRRPETETLNDARYPPLNLRGSGFFGPDVEHADLRLNHQLPVLDPRYEGDFFDPDEIETCLRSYGVTIPPRKEFVTAHLDLTMFDAVESIGQADHQYHDSATDSLHPDINPGVHWGRDFTDFAPASAHNTQGVMGTATGQTPALAEAMPQREYWQTPLVSRIKVTVDVERLITCLMNSTVCLGRTPGVQVLDVRKALKESLIYGV